MHGDTRVVPGPSTAGRWAPIAAVGAAIPGLAYLAANDPAVQGTFLRCPLNALTGHWCPGCGMTRAAHHLVHGDIGAAFGANALWPVFVALLVGGWLTWFRMAGDRPAPRWPSEAPVWSWVTLGALMVAFTIARNLPVAPFDALAP